MIPANVVQWAQQAQSQTGVSDLAAALALSTVGPESSFNPNAVGKAGEIGLTQLLPVGGVGAGHSSVELYDPVGNLSIAMLEIQRRLNLSGGDTFAALQPWSTRSSDLAGLGEAQAAIAGGNAGSFVTPIGTYPAAPLVLVAVIVAAVVLLQ